MKNIIVAIFFMALLFFPTLKLSSAEKTAIGIIAPPAGKKNYLTMIETVAAKYKVDPQLLIKIIDCENRGWIPDKQSSFIHHGVREESYGLAQIHLPAWRGVVTKEQAIDPLFSIEFMAKQVSAGKARLWSCYRFNYNAKRIQKAAL